MSKIVRRAIAIVSALGAMLGIAGGSAAGGELEGGFLNQPLAEVQKTGFFTWFHLGETRREAGANGVQKVVFQPTGEKFHDLAIVTVTINSESTIQRIELVLKRSFISGGNGVFAADIAKSFLHDAPPRDDASQLTVLADEIQYRARGSQTVIVGPGYKTPELPNPPTRAYQTYSGERASDSRKLAHCKFEIVNEHPAGGDQLRMSFALR